VTADGKLVYSKLQAGSFPDNAEVLQSLRALPK